MTWVVQPSLVITGWVISWGPSRAPLSEHGWHSWQRSMIPLSNIPCVGLQILPLATLGMKGEKETRANPGKVCGTLQLPLCWSGKSIPVCCPREKQVVRAMPLMSAEEKEGFIKGALSCRCLELKWNLVTKEESRNPNVAYRPGCLPCWDATGEKSAENGCFLETLCHVEEVTKLLKLLNETRGLAEGEKMDMNSI